MMVFSVAASLGTHVVFRDTHQTKFQCQFLCRTEDNNRIVFKSSKHKAIQRAIFVSKLEFTVFDERKSPDEIASLLDCTSWSGAGPGLMDAVTQGAMLAGKPVGGFKIGKEAGEWTASNFHPYLPSQNYLTCRFFSARKHGLVDAVVRSSDFDKTAVVVLPGGIGTLDEMFEIMALIQLERIGSELPVPFLLMNYDSFYSKLLDFLNDCEDWGTVSKGEVASLWKVCNSNSEALAYLEEFYCISSGDQSKDVTKLYRTYE
ncbi:hypothetical protein Fmac_027123 [Flemingia macrophylla]|uniref:Cytokinin riboside 5'-monophosphate phosphoribohydrolase n=1 Tax=Flemingia macrophylla TaxID=520843 RepID=A0ABD1LGT9_9FABA